MASSITDPKDFARHINGKMLADFLRSQDPPIPFDSIEDMPTNKKKRVSEDAVNRFIDVIKNLTDTKRADRIFAEMLYINELSSERHTTELERQALEDDVTYSLADLATCENYDERALWWYIHHRNVFDRYFERADTENLAGLRELLIKEEYVVPKESIADETKLATFGAGVAHIFENILRGRKFKTAHFIEEDCILVRVYLENLPDNQLVFEGIANEVRRTAGARSLFSIILVYNPGEKTLGIRTNKPAENVQLLAELFCRTFLGCGYADTTHREYNVENKGSIRQLELTPDPESTIERCYLKAVEYMRSGDFNKTLRLDVGGKNLYEGTEQMELLIHLSHVNEHDWRPRKFDIKFVFKKPDTTKGRSRQITATLTKRGVNLKNTPEDQKIREFLKAKSFIS